MNAATALPPEADQPVDQQVRMLRELAELSMMLARAAAAKALRQAEGEAASGPDPMLVFAKLSREIRETIKLEAAIAAGRDPAQPAASATARRPAAAQATAPTPARLPPAAALPAAASADERRASAPSLQRQLQSNPGLPRDLAAAL